MNKTKDKKYNTNELWLLKMGGNYFKAIFLEEMDAIKFGRYLVKHLKKYHKCVPFAHQMPIEEIKFIAKNE